MSKDSPNKTRATEAPAEGSRDRRSLGARGEDLVAEWYVSAGYEVIERNWRCRAGELDLVAGRDDDRQRPQVVFCEVKARTSHRFGTGWEAVTAAKQARLRRLGAMWLAARRPRQFCDVRFDVAAVDIGRDGRPSIEVRQDVL